MSVTNPSVSSSRLPLFSAEEHANDGKYHLLLAASGSVATIKIPNIVRGLSTLENLSIRIVLTDSAANFLQGQSDEQPDLAALGEYPNVEAIYRDKDEWTPSWTRGAPILHIELRRWADVLVIAPLSANTLAKIANGLCDNLLTSVIRAWEVASVPELDGNSSAPGEDDQIANALQKRIVVAPAMNTAMWRHPLTALHLEQISAKQVYHWFDVLRPIEKELACGDTGTGAMCDWRDIVKTIVERIASSHKGRELK